jgi:hypothetical protein
VQQFEGTAAILETASPEAKLRAKEMEKIGYKGDDAIEADEVKVYRAHVRLICVDVAFIVRDRRAIAPRRGSPNQRCHRFPSCCSQHQQQSAIEHARAHCNSDPRLPFSCAGPSPNGLREPQAHGLRRAAGQGHGERRSVFECVPSAALYLDLTKCTLDPT